jgi:uncharacterized protein YciI
MMNRIIIALALGFTCTLCFGQEPKVDKYANRRFFVLQFTPGAGWEKDKPMSQQKLEDHRAYYQKLLEKGLVVIGGGFTEENAGMSILKVKDREMADSLVRNDPAVLSGIFKIEVKPMFAVFKGESRETLDVQGITFKKQ